MGQVFVSQHASCPFGAIASVHAWERVGAAIAHLARKFLKLALLRYVDDIFGPERCEASLHTPFGYISPGGGLLCQARNHGARVAMLCSANTGVVGADSGGR